MFLFSVWLLGCLAEASSYVMVARDAHRFWPLVQWLEARPNQVGPVTVLPNLKMVLFPEFRNPKHVLPLLQKMPGVVTLEPNHFRYWRIKPSRLTTVDGLVVTWSAEDFGGGTILPFNLFRKKEVDFKASFHEGDVSSALRAIRADWVWSKGYQGQNVRVLVLDTGIDRDHPALSPNIEKIRNFVMDQQQPYAEFDHHGHGTHVAGIIGGRPWKGYSIGVAPRVRLLVGRVCGTDGCSLHSLLSALEWAIAEKVDIINMSYGTPTASVSEEMALKEAYQHGITLVALAGNEGDSELNYPAAYKEVIAVGAIDEHEERANFSNWGSQLDLVAPGVNIWSAVPQGMGREAEVMVRIEAWSDHPEEAKTTVKHVAASTFLGTPKLDLPVEGGVVFAGLGRPQDFREDLEVRGQVVLVDRGEIFFYEKAEAAMERGAIALVVVNDSDRLFSGALTRDGSVLPIPVTMIRNSDGRWLKELLQKGYRITMSVRTFAGDYAGMSGTSMATPFVTGVIALLKSAKPQLTPAEIRNVLKRSARPLNKVADPYEVGAGLVDAASAFCVILASSCP